MTDAVSMSNVTTLNMRNSFFTYVFESVLATALLTACGKKGQAEFEQETRTRINQN